MQIPAFLASLVLLALGSCAAPTPSTPWTQLSPDSASAEPRQAAADHGPTIHVGLGSAYSPSTPVIGASMDYHIDENLTIGPALQLGTDDNSSIFAGFGQLRYWFGKESDKKRILPYLQAGIGVAYMDRDGRGSGTDFLVNIGGGVRLLTGDRYRIGSNVLYNSVSGNIADDDSYFTWEILQMSFDF